MRFNSLPFLLNEMLLNLWRQRLTTLACITTAAISVTILGIFLGLAWHVTHLAIALPQTLEVFAYFQTSIPRERVVEMQQKIEAWPEVRRVQLVTREEAWRKYKNERSDFPELADITENPLPDKLEIRTISPEQNIAVAAKLRKLPELDDVVAKEEILSRLLAIGKIVRTASLFLAALLALGTSAVIGNAIRVTLYARRRDIEVMQLVGATDAFIRFPFVAEGALVGACGAALASAAVLCGLRYLQTQVVSGMTFMNEVRVEISEPGLAAVLIILGIAAGTFGSAVSLRRFLQT